MNISAISKDQVLSIWAEIVPGLDNLLENYTLGRWTAPEVLQNLLEGEWQLFVITEDERIIACLVCSIMDGHKKTLEIGLCWGTSADAWSGEVSQAFDQLAREMDCEQLALDGRPGWRKIMRKHGFELNSVRYTRQVDG